MISRRQFMVGASAGGLAACMRGPAVRTKQPAITHGVQAGDVQADRALVWSRCDESARMIVEWSTVASFANARTVAGSVVGPTTDHTGWVELRDLPIGQTIAYRGPDSRGHVRSESARSDVRSRDQVPVGAPTGRRQPCAVGWPAVLRHRRRHGRCAARRACRDRWRATVRDRATARLGEIVPFS